MRELARVPHRFQRTAMDGNDLSPDRAPIGFIGARQIGKGETARRLATALRLEKRQSPRMVEASTTSRRTYAPDRAGNLGRWLRHYRHSC
jgi:hypothetical protein